MAKKKENYLDFIPVVNGQNTWDRGEDGVVTIHMVNRGFTLPWPQKLFHTPRVKSHQSWMSTAASLWMRIDGVKTVGQLALELKEAYGEKAEPLYDRLVKYMQILRNNRFILFVGRDQVKE